MQQHLIAEPLRLGLKATDDVAVEHIDTAGIDPLLDQKADGRALRPVVGARDRVAQFFDRGPDALARAGGHPRFAADTSETALGETLAAAATSRIFDRRLPIVPPDRGFDARQFSAQH